jgi:predicted Zn-dependent peptidase
MRAQPEEWARAGPSVLPTREGAQAGGDGDYHKATLENGIRVVTQRMPEARSISLGILVDANPRHERPEQCGLAHLTEHVMFQGTGSRDARQIARLMDLAGGHIGGFTTRDYTCYFATVLDEHCPYALDLLGDILLNSTFPEASVATEKQAILREIDGARDTPDVRANELLKAQLWPDHPLGRPVAGRPETVGRLTREDVIYFVHRQYLPANLVLAAAGNLRHEDLVTQARDAFWRMLGGATATAGPPPQPRPGVVLEARPLAQVYFALGLRGHPYAHADRYGLHVLGNLLGGGVSSRLCRRLREGAGLVYHVGAEYHAYRDAGLLVVEGSTAPEYLAAVLGMTLVELWRLAVGEEPAGEEELWKARMHLRGQHLLGGESSSTVMSRLATQEFYFGEHLPSEQVLRRIEAVDGVLVQRLAEQLLVPSLSQPTVAVVGPKAPQHYTVRAIEDLLVQVNPLTE